MSVWTTRATGGAHGLDRVEVLRALGILIDPSQTFELRGVIPGVGAHSRVCKGQDLPGAVESAWELSDHSGLYFTLNPLRHDLTGSARVKDVLERRWLLVDVDTIRPDNSNAADSEKAESSKVVGCILDYLSEIGWSFPCVSDSGNGWHLLYRISLANDKLSQQLVKSVLAELGRRFDTPAATIDRAVHDAARICKLPGSWVRKGIDSVGRPHRLARLVYVPDELQIVTVEQLHELAQAGKTEPLKRSPWAIHATNGHGMEAYCRSAIERECGRVCMAPNGDLNNQLNRSSFALGTMATWPEMVALNAQASLAQAARQANLEDWRILPTINSGWNAGVGQPRERPVDPHVNGVASKGTLPPNVSPIVWGHTIKPKKVEWLVPGRIPANKMTTFAGQTGMGKTFAICNLSALITTGGEIPFSGGLCFNAGTVLIISAEDDADDTLLPRFNDMGGDSRKLAFLSPEAEDHFSLAALDLLGKSLDAMGPDVRLIAIDPPTSYLGKTDDHKNAELRGLLTPIKRFCKARNVPLVFVTHVNKAMGQKIDAMARVMGSVAWVAAVRAAHMFCQDPEMPGKRLYVPLKVNNARAPKALRYIIEEVNGQAIMKWIEEVDITADEAIGAVPRKSSGIVATEWLVDRFREKNEWESAELKRLGIDAGLTGHQLFKSPEVNALPIDKRQRITSNGDRYWVWRARDGWPPTESAESAESVDVSPY